MIVQNIEEKRFGNVITLKWQDLRDADDRFCQFKGQDSPIATSTLFSLLDEIAVDNGLIFFQMITLGDSQMFVFKVLEHK